MANERRPSALEILKILDRSNCRECGVPTCMAFAALVVQGQRRLSDCPTVSRGALEQYAHLGEQPGEGDELAASMNQLMGKAASVDFDEAAERLGGGVDGDRLAIPCMGRIFQIDRDGRLHAQCHVNQWVHGPLLDYITSGAGEDPRGEWVHFAELSGAASWTRFFEHRCESAIKQVVDESSELFFEIMSLFEAEAPDISDDLEGDWAYVIYPLPKVPLLICYWKAEGEFPSKLSVLFDTATNANLSPESVFYLTNGIAQMLKKMVLTHSHRGR